MLIKEDDLPHVVNAVLYIANDEGLKFKELKHYVNSLMSHKCFKTYELAHKIYARGIFIEKRKGKYFFSGDESVLETTKAKWVLSVLKKKYNKTTGHSVCRGKNHERRKD